MAEKRPQAAPRPQSTRQEHASRIHQTLRVTPAMAAGVTKRLWEMTDLVEMVEAWEESGKLAA